MNLSTDGTVMVFVIPVWPGILFDNPPSIPGCSVPVFVIQ